MRGRVLRQYLQLARSQWWRPEAIERRQNESIARVLRHAVTHVPHYRDRGLDPRTIRNAADLLRFPELTKDVVRAEGMRMIADGYDLRNLHRSRTSGHTGEPAVTYFDDESWSLSRYALKIRRMVSTTGLVRRRVLIVSDRSNTDSANTARIAALSLGPIYREMVVSLHDRVDTHIKVIDGFRPDVIHAYPSYLLDLLDAYRRAGRPAPVVRWLCTSSELLRSTTRTRIEAGFHGRIHDVYGSTEFKEVAWQCRFGTYHLNFESVFVEIVDDGTGDGAGRILLSTLCNRAMPLLRYVTGDRGRLTGSACECGRSSPALAIVAGRETELIALPSGRRLSPYLLELDDIEDLPGLRQFRFVHSAPDTLRLELVCESVIGPDVLQRLNDRIAETLGEPMRLELVQLREIPRPPSGKRSIYQRDYSLGP